MKKIYFIFIMAMIVSSCTGGSYTLIGQERKPIDSSLVKLYAEPPRQYKTIATVEARSILGFDEQHEINDAVAELKEQAADLGANGIMSIKISYKAQGYVSAKIVTGKAVYVIKE